MNKKVLSALIGLVGAINNNGKTEDTDTIIRTALLSISEDNSIDEIHREKYRISPDCASCRFPCGNTSDYPLEAFEVWPEEQRALKEQILDEILRIANTGNTHAKLPDLVLKGIAYIGYDLEEESYRRLLEELIVLPADT